MDLVDKLTELASRIRRQKDSVMTEEAAKTAFVLPFLQALGYDVFNPSEVVPELTADHGLKKGEKVDYAVKQDDKIALLIECKSVGADLTAKHASQLYRYFSVTDARFGVLTDGIRYVFFTDLDRANAMDDRPFFEFNMFGFEEADVEELKKFMKSSFDLETIISTASNLKYHRALLAEIKREFETPTEDIVRIFTGRVYSGRFIQQVKEQFTDLTQRAFEDFLRERVNVRLKAAIDTGKESRREEAGPIETEAEPAIEIETTEEEMAAYRIVQAIGAEVVDVERIALRDARSYCAILLDNNNRKTICRLHFMKTKKAVSVFTPNGEQRTNIEKVTDLYGLRESIRMAIRQHDPQSKQD